MVVAIILLTILLTGCRNAATDNVSIETNVTTWETGNIETWETETILTEDILVEDIQVEEIIVEEIEIKDLDSASELKHEMCENGIYLTDDNGDGIIRIWGKEEYFTQDKYMAYVYYDVESYEIDKILINYDFISKKVFETLEKYNGGNLLYEF